MKMISKIINNEKVQIWAALLGFLVLNVVFGAVGGAWYICPYAVGCAYGPRALISIYAWGVREKGLD